MPGRAARRRSGLAERGTVSAETAMVLPVLVGITLVLAWTISVGVAQVRVVDAAREAARAAARGEPPSAAMGWGRRVGPPGTRITVSAGSHTVRATASAVVFGPGGILAPLPDVTVRASAVGAAEPTS